MNSCWAQILKLSRAVAHDKIWTIFHPLQFGLNSVFNIHLELREQAPSTASRSDNSAYNDTILICFVWSCHNVEASDTTISSVQSTSSSPAMTSHSQLTTTFSPCVHDEKNTKLMLMLLRYNNPDNLKVSGLPCDEDGSPCDIALEICVSHINSR